MKENKKSEISMNENAKDTMRAFAAFAPDRIEQIALPIPEPDDYEVLVKHEGCVFCNSTDKMIVENLFATKAYPVVFGHESFGKVIKVGARVKNFKLGDRVICSNAIVQGYNGEFYSSWGGFAEYGIAGDLEAYTADHGAPEGENAYRARYAANSKIPADLPPEEACLLFPLAETASALKQAGDVKGKTVAIVGTGIVGYFFTFFAKMYGAAHVVCLGRRKSRLDIARRIGADAVYIDTNEAAADLAARGGADFVFECSGNARVFESGIPYLGEGGTLAIYAVSHAPYAIDLARLPAAFSYKRISPDVPKALDFVCALMREGKIPTELFLTHQWHFDEVPKAFSELLSGNVIKGLVTIP
jgi:2-desacetyl-2-hydroxyethyl bacteriochlorophyllide A dehydrogenase